MGNFYSPSPAPVTGATRKSGWSADRGCFGKRTYAWVDCAPIAALPFQHCQGQRLATVNMYWNTPMQDRLRGRCSFAMPHSSFPETACMASRSWLLGMYSARSEPPVRSFSEGTPQRIGKDGREGKGRGKEKEKDTMMAKCVELQGETCRCIMVQSPPDRYVRSVHVFVALSSGGPSLVGNRDNLSYSGSGRATQPSEDAAALMLAHGAAVKPQPMRSIHISYSSAALPGQNIQIAHVKADEYLELFVVPPARHLSGRRDGPFSSVGLLKPSHSPSTPPGFGTGHSRLGNGLDLAGALLSSP